MIFVRSCKNCIMTPSNDLDAPEDLDAALIWLVETVRDPEKKARMNENRQSTAAFIEKATSILSALAKREGLPALSDLLDEANIEAREQPNT